MVQMVAFERSNERSSDFPTGENTIGRIARIALRSKLRGELQLAPHILSAADTGELISSRRSREAMNELVELVELSQ